MENALREKEPSETALREFLAEVNEKYPCGWLVAIAELRVISASADFDELLDALRLQGRDPRKTLVVPGGRGTSRICHYFHLTGMHQADSFGGSKESL